MSEIGHCCDTINRNDTVSGEIRPHFCPSYACNILDIEFVDTSLTRRATLGDLSRKRERQDRNDPVICDPPVVAGPCADGRHANRATRRPTSRALPTMRQKIHRHADRFRRAGELNVRPCTPGRALQGGHSRPVGRFQRGPGVASDAKPGNSGQPAPAMAMALNSRPIRSGSPSLRAVSIMAAAWAGGRPRARRLVR